MKRRVKSYRGWYKLVCPEKFLKPVDNFMKSFKRLGDELYVEYKSRLEYRAFRYADMNPTITSWSVEPFPIMYVKPTTGRRHRYYIDLVVNFKNGSTYFIEVKPFAQTKQPRKPKNYSSGGASTKSINNYKKSYETWLINESKWASTREYCSQRGFKFIHLTERELK